MRYGMLKARSGSRKASVYQGSPPEPTRWKSLSKSSRSPYLNCSPRTVFPLRLTDCFSKSRRYARNMRMLLPDGRKLRAARQSHSSKHGCTFVRQGKGDHEIWQSPINGCRFMVDNKIKSPIWANITLKKAGIPKRSEEHTSELQ